MPQQILFLQGGGDNGYQAGRTMVNALQKALGNEYYIHYPELASDESAADFGWIAQIQTLVAETKGPVIVVAHSLGASMLVKYLSEHPVDKAIQAVFLLAAPFWSGHEEWKKGLKLKENFAERLPQVPLYFYHSKDDDEVPFDHLDMYKQNIKEATFREVETGGHQFDGKLGLVGADIKTLQTV